MRIGKLFNPMGTFSVPIGSIKKLEIDPFLAAGLDTASNAINSTLNWAFQSGENHKQRKFQREENQKNRDWQREENQKARDYNTEMWEKQNLYNTPSAQRERLREAGYNPWMSGSGSPQSVAGAAAPSPSNSPAQTGAFSPLMSPGTFLGDVGSKLLRGSQIKAETANQSAETLTKLIDAYREARKNGMSKDDALSLIQPYLKSLGSLEGETNKYLRMVNLDIDNKSWDAETKQLEFDIRSNTGMALASSQVANIRQNTLESAKRVILLAKQSDLTDAQIKTEVKKQIELIASAYHFKKIGDKYAAETSTIDSIRDYLVRSYRSAAEISENEAGESNALFEQRQGARGWQTSKEGIEHALGTQKIKDHKIVNAVDRASGIVERWMPKMFTTPTSNVKSYEFGFDESGSKSFVHD